jgi:competence protein ComEA
VPVRSAARRIDGAHGERRVDQHRSARAARKRDERRGVDGEHTLSVPRNRHEGVTHTCVRHLQAVRVPELRLTRRQIAVGAALALALVLLGSRVLGHSHAAVAPPIPTAGAATRPQAAAPPVVVDVVGAVRRPGLYRLARTARVADALAQAGGATRKAALELVNLAAPLADGEQVVVPRRGAPGAAAPGGTGATTGPVHLSTATLEQLDSLPGIGPVTAQKILDYRQQHGAFSSVDELDAVPGIGPARIEQLKGLVAP